MRVVLLAIIITMTISSQAQVMQRRVIVPQTVPTVPQNTQDQATDADKAAGQTDAAGNPVTPASDPAGTPPNPPSNTPPAPTPPPNNEMQTAAPERAVVAPSLNSPTVVQPAVNYVDGITYVNSLPINFVLTPGDQVVVAGRGFGAAMGRLEAILPGYPNQPTPLQVSTWSDGQVQAILPTTISGVTDGTMTLRLETADKTAFNSRRGTFKALRQKYLVNKNVDKYVTVSDELGLFAKYRHVGYDDFKSNGVVFHWKPGVDQLLSGICTQQHTVTVQTLPAGFTLNNLSIDHPPLRGKLGNWSLTDMNSLKDPSYRGSYQVTRVSPTTYRIGHACQHRGYDPSSSKARDPFPEYVPYVGSAAANSWEDIIAYRIQLELYGPVGVPLPH